MPSLLQAARTRVHGRRTELLLALLVLLPVAFPRSLRVDGSPWYWAPWLAGVAAAAVTSAYRLRRGAGDDRRARAHLAAAALLLTAFATANTGGASSPLWGLYFVLLAVVSHWFGTRRAQGAFLALVCLLEGASLLQDRPPGPGGGFGGPLFAFLLSFLLLLLLGLLLQVLYLARQRRLAETLREYQRLHEEAEKLEAAPGPKTASEPEARSASEDQARRRATVAELDRRLDRLLELTGRTVRARAVVFYQREGNRLILRSAAGEVDSIDHRSSLRVGEGLIGGAARMMNPLLITELGGKDSGIGYRQGVPPPSSLMAVPVAEQGVLVGVLAADHPERERFSRDDRQILSGFAEEVNLVLKNTKESAMRDRRSATMAALYDISSSLGRTLDPDRMVETLVEEMPRLIPYDQCAVFIRDRERGKVVLRAQEGFLFKAGKEVVLNLRKTSLASMIFTRGAGFVFSDRRGLDIVPGYIGKEEMRSFLGAPLRLQDEVLGVVVLGSATPGNFTNYQLEQLNLLAIQAALELSNAFLHRKVEKMALTDGLTGLYNHRHFQERLDYEVRRSDRSGLPFSLLLLDIDHFKKLNDTYGHPFGDEVLRSVASQVAAVARSVDFVARYGGEEFALILAGTDSRGCRNMAERILKVVRSIPFSFQGEGLPPVTVSVGSATCPDDGTDKEELVRRADQALYLAKESGRNGQRSFSDVVAAGK